VTVLSAQTIRRLGLVTPCLQGQSRDANGNSRGLSCCGYDITIGEDVVLRPGDWALAGATEWFCLPPSVMGVVHDKSSLARRGLAVQNTVLEPGWRGYLTLELTCHGSEVIRLLSNDAAAQVVFHRLDEPTEMPYAGKYQNQEAGPVRAR